MHHSSVTGYSIGSALIHIFGLAGLWEIPLQIHTVGIGHRSVGTLRHGVGLSEGDAPIQEELETGAELLFTKFRRKLKKVGKTARPFRYDLNQILMIIQWK